MTISDQIYEAVSESGWTSQQIALAANVPIPTITRFVNGERGISLESAEALADLFGMRLTKPKKVNLSHLP